MAHGWELLNCRCAAQPGDCGEKMGLQKMLATGATLVGWEAPTRQEEAEDQEHGWESQEAHQAHPMAMIQTLGGSSSSPTLDRQLLAQRNAGRPEW